MNTLRFVRYPAFAARNAAYIQTTPMALTLSGRATYQFSLLKPTSYSAQAASEISIPGQAAHLLATRRLVRCLSASAARKVVAAPGSE